MKILAEADELGADRLVNLITDDSDFLYFKAEIERELKVKITALLDTPHFFDVKQESTFGDKFVNNQKNHNF